MLIVLVQQTSLAKNQDVVVVTINYRTNVFGFPFGSDAAEVPINERNLGLLDQELALQWARSNVHAFGGDPNCISLMGQPAGASSVTWFLQRHPINPPFQSAILLSSAFLVEVTPTTNEQAWTGFAKAVGCTESAGVQRLECLKQVPGSTIHNFLNGPTAPSKFSALIDKCDFLLCFRLRIITPTQYYGVRKPCTTYPRPQCCESPTFPGRHGKRWERVCLWLNGCGGVPQCHI